MSTKRVRPSLVLVAEDDADERMFLKDAFDQNGIVGDLRFVEDGCDLIEYLRNAGKYTDRLGHPRPDIILLDLNMPKMDGREALKEIKTDAALRQIPIVVFTSSKDDRDVVCAYDLGANSFVAKPTTVAGFVDVLKALRDYWLALVRLPQRTPLAS